MLKSKKQWSLCKFTLKTLNKVAVISNFLAFFQFLVDKFTLLDPDPGGKMNADPCGSGSTALVLEYTGIYTTEKRRHNLT